MHWNNQATIKTRYCGHLYSPLLRKWTHLDQRGQVSYYKEGGLKRTQRVTHPVWITDLAGCLSKFSSPECELLLKGGARVAWLSLIGYIWGWKGAWAMLFARLFSRPLFNGWLGCLMSSQWVLLCRKSDSKRDHPWLVCDAHTLPYFVCLEELQAVLVLICLNDVEGGWFACRWVRPDATNHSGIRHVYACLLKVSLVIGSPHWRWVTFVFHSRDKGTLPRTCENGKWGDAICGFKEGSYSYREESTLELQWVH